MALDVLITTDRILSDPVGRWLINHLQNNAQTLGIDDAALYYDFPTYSDYETVTDKPDALLLSPQHGILAIRLIDGANAANLQAAEFQSVDELLGQFSSILIGRLLKSRSLRKGLSTLRFAVTPVILIMSLRQGFDVPELENSQIVTSLGGVDALLGSLRVPTLESEGMAEARSVLEGAKALTRPQKRIISDPTNQRPAAALAKLEAEIANFDERQRRAALVAVPGPQRIRGLAGSGKTVILAMRAAHLHLTRPEERILVTSLRGASEPR